jgi:hypothetical protein
MCIGVFIIRLYQNKGGGGERIKFRGYDVTHEILFFFFYSSAGSIYYYFFFNIFYLLLHIYRHGQQQHL